MATSTTYSFNPDIGDLAEEAFERAGLELRGGYDLRSARRSIDYLTLEWQNRGLNLWTVEQTTLAGGGVGDTLTKGTSTYDLAASTISVLEVIIRTDSGSLTNQSDLQMTRVSMPTYASIPNKLTQARPLQYYIDRQEVGSTNSTITFWPTPDESDKYTVLYWRMKRIQDSGTSAGLTMDVPGRFIPALVAGLAYQIAMKRPEAAGRVAPLKQAYEEQYSLAAQEDREKASVHFVPGGYTY